MENRTINKKESIATRTIYMIDLNNNKTKFKSIKKHEWIKNTDYKTAIWW